MMADMTILGSLMAHALSSDPTLPGLNPDLSSTGNFTSISSQQQLWPNNNTIVSLITATVDPPRALPQKATPQDLRWQPALDFDTDGCYNVPAIDAQGNIAQGLPSEWASVSGGCHDAADLDNNNVYARQRCNDNGWCAYHYGYYFEKDVSVPYFFAGGHRHDWEHITVWVKDDKAQYVSASQHGEFQIKAAAAVRWDGEHPKMVYHKDGGSTHCFRFGNEKDDAIENDKGVWFRGDLVSYNGFPGDTRELLFAHDFGKAIMDLKDENFAGALGRAKPSGITFDTGVDFGSPGTP